MQTLKRRPGQDEIETALNEMVHGPEAERADLQSLQPLLGKQEADLERRLTGPRRPHRNE